MVTGLGVDQSAFLNPSTVVPGTGQTVADLQALGYSNLDILSLWAEAQPSSSSDSRYLYYIAGAGALALFAIVMSGRRR